MPEPARSTHRTAPWYTKVWPAPASDQGRATHTGWGGAGGGPHRVSRLGDPDHEDQLGREEGPNEVPVDAVQVGAQRPHQRQEDEGHQQGGQRQGHRSVGQSSGAGPLRAVGGLVKDKRT